MGDHEKNAESKTDVLPASEPKLPEFDRYESIVQQPLYRAQIPFIRPWVRGAVLDVGAHFGRLSTLNSSTISLDIGKRWLLRGVELGNITSAVVGSGLALPFKDACFDTVLAIGVAEHIPNSSMVAFLDELTRVTKSTGRLVLQATSPYALFALLRLGIWNDSLHPCSPFRLRRALLRRGWRPIASMSSGLLGVTRILPQTVMSPIPWARSVGQIFVRK